MEGTDHLLYLREGTELLKLFILGIWNMEGETIYIFTFLLYYFSFFSTLPSFLNLVFLFFLFLKCTFLIVTFNKMTI